MVGKLLRQTFAIIAAQGLGTAKLNYFLMNGSSTVEGAERI